MKAYAPLLAAGTLLTSMVAYAGPSDYVYTPTVENGEKEIDFKLGSAESGDDPRESATSLGLGYGATEWWFTEVYAKFKKQNDESTKFDAIEWENKFQLTDPGKYPVDTGFVVEVEKPHDSSEGWEFRYGPLFQTEFGKLQLNTNLLLESRVDDAAHAPTVFQYQWQVKYRWQQRFEFGLQGFGETGKWNDWSSIDDQEHKLGPAVFGKLPVTDKQFISYNAAWLVGTTPASPDHTLRMQIEYEFY